MGLKNKPKIINGVNNYGESIDVKLENGIIMVHHEDCSDDFISFNDLVLKCLLHAEEVTLIIKLSKQLYINELLLAEQEIEKTKNNQERVKKLFLSRENKNTK